MSDEEIVKDKYIKMYDAMVSQNIEELSKVLDDSFVLVHMTGMEQSKKEFLNAVENGKLRYYSAKHDEIKIISQSENEIHLQGDTNTLASPFGMSKLKWRLRQDITFKKINNEWLMTLSKASTY